jgi:hypothetical protein
MWDFSWASHPGRSSRSLRGKLAVAVQHSILGVDTQRPWLGLVVTNGFADHLYGGIYLTSSPRSHNSTERGEGGRESLPSTGRYRNTFSLTPSSEQSKYRTEPPPFQNSPPLPLPPTGLQHSLTHSPTHPPHQIHCASTTNASRISSVTRPPSTRTRRSEAFSS